MKAKTLIVGMLGTTMEWAEYVFYGYMAYQLSSTFFVEGNETVNLIKTFGVFAAGYLMRPLGAIVFGTIGDWYGRRTALCWSMLLMGFATACIGLLPGYEQVGIWAPISLLVLRLIQGLAVSGEYNGASIWIIEQHPDRPAFAGSMIPASAAFGMVIGGGASFLVSLSCMPEWAWRVPFLMGGLGCALAWWLRYRLNDKDSYTPSKSRLGLSELFISHKKGLFQIGVIAAMTGIYVYVCNVYLVVYMTTYLDFAPSTATMVAMLGQILVTLLIPLAGLASDHWGSKRVYMTSMALATVGAPLYFALINAASFGSIGLGLVVYALINGLMSGSMMHLMQGLIPSAARYRGISLAWSISVAIFGGSAMMVAQWLQMSFSSNLACSLYVSAFAVIAWWTVRGIEQSPITKAHPSVAQFKKLIGAEDVTDRLNQ